MREQINLTLSLTLIDNDSMEWVMMRDAEDEDKVVSTGDFPYSTVGKLWIAEIVRAYVVAWFEQSERSITVGLENHRIKLGKEVEKQRAIQVGVPDTEVWTCPVCEFVNVLDTSCAKCDKPRPG